MKKLILGIAIVATVVAWGDNVQTNTVESPQLQPRVSARQIQKVEANGDRHAMRCYRQKYHDDFVARVRNIPISETCRQASWERNECDTNDVEVTVCTGLMKISSATSYYVFRTMRFDKDGRLKSISEVNDVREKGRYDRSENQENLLIPKEEDSNKPQWLKDVSSRCADAEKERLETEDAAQARGDCGNSAMPADGLQQIQGEHTKSNSVPKTVWKHEELKLLQDEIRKVREERERAETSHSVNDV